MRVRESQRAGQQQQHTHNNTNDRRCEVDETAKISTEFLDIFLFLHSSFDLCIEELEKLLRVKEDYGRGVRFVAVYLDRNIDGRVEETLRRRSVKPDFILHDPRLLLMKEYSLRSVPAVLLAGFDGKIEFFHKGRLPESAELLYRGLDRLNRKKEVEGSPPLFQEVHRIHGEAIQFLLEGDKKMAAIYLERILELMPDLTTLSAFLGDLYWDLGERSEAAR